MPRSELVSGVVGACALMALMLCHCADPTEPVSTPSPPSDLRVTEVTPGTVTMAWKDNSLDETGFHIDREDVTQADLFGFDYPLAANETTYTDVMLQPDHEYRYRVRAMKKVGDDNLWLYSGYCEMVTARTTVYNGELPMIPTNLRVKALNHLTVELAWDHNESDTVATGLVIERGTMYGFGQWALAGLSDSSHITTGVWNPGHMFYFRMYAYSDKTNIRSGYSNTISVTIPDP